MMSRQARAMIVAAVLAVLTQPTARAEDVSIPLRVYFNKPASKTKFLAKGAFALPDPLAANPAVGGAEIVFTSGAATDTIALPAAGWSALGNPPGASGFRYRDPSGASCKSLLITARSIKGLCRGSIVGAPPFVAGSDPPLSIVLSVGSAALRYCGECPNGGTQSGNGAQLTKLKGCGAPAACPAVGPQCPTMDGDTTACDALASGVHLFCVLCCANDGACQPACNAAVGASCADPLLNESCAEAVNAAGCTHCCDD